ncbi:MAG TPA: patatin-like phospholipase family protein [Steroidobacteraceae bacterium]|nr:patatin-like phospholipase family protein [Steroidobacteraceae bacterium]
MTANHQGPGTRGAPQSFDSVLSAEQAHRAPLGVAPLGVEPLGVEPGAPEQTAKGPVGLALSGGGIRSATFSLGVLQALAGHRRLSSFDYLSTVSGGGYIGSWLSAWIARNGLKRVQDELAKRGTEGGVVPETAEPAPVVWLRKYSNYLAPKVGIVSIDSLTLMSIWLRNVLLNLLIVVSFMIVLLLVPVLVLPVIPELLHWDWLHIAANALGLVVLPLAICVNLSRLSRQSSAEGTWLMTTRGVLVTVLGPGTLAAIFGSLTTFGGRFDLGNWRADFEIASGLLAVVGVAWIVMQLQHDPHKKSSAARRVMHLLPDGGAFVIAALVAINVVFTLLCAERLLFSNGVADSEYDYVKLLTFGPPGFLVTFGIGGFVFVGLAGRAYYERSREWWGRLNAWFFIVGTVWFLAMVTPLYVPALTKWMIAHAYGWLRAVAGVSWLGSLAAALLGPRINTRSQRTSNHLMGVLNVAAYVVVIGFVVAVATLTRESLTLAATAVDAPSAAAAVDVRPALSACTSAASPPAQPVGPRAGESPPAAPAEAPCLKSYFRADVRALLLLRNARIVGVPLACAAFSISLLVLLLFGWRVDVNKFSLHNMYKNRLIRCYLGASRRRNPQPFTGFDEHDDLALTSLATQRPLHVINTCLNLSQGENLAWQERKAASFVLTPIYCGFSLGKSQGDSTLRNTSNQQNSNAIPDYASIPGFRPTRYFSGDDESARSGFSLGMAMAVSGAAASPNMGARTRPAHAFMMTLFDARLGRWTANPAGSKWKRASPSFGLFCFLQELFGWSNENRNFVYLSDGGHFENLGLYELVRRRCSTIWIVDASADRMRNCEDLGRAIRQCRVDFGVEITLPLSDTLGAAPALLPKCGFARGTIDYGSDYDRGVLIYIKPTLCAGTPEPDDVLAYAKREPTFPHQSTADQFFDESQFESYRRLGLHIGDECLGQHIGTLPWVAPG